VLATVDFGPSGKMLRTRCAVGFRLLQVKTMRREVF
jgi:hypothetical protein